MSSVEIFLLGVYFRRSNPLRQDKKNHFDMSRITLKNSSFFLLKQNHKTSEFFYFPPNASKNFFAIEVTRTGGNRVVYVVLFFVFFVYYANFS